LQKAKANANANAITENSINNYCITSPASAPSNTHVSAFLSWLAPGSKKRLGKPAKLSSPYISSNIYNICLKPEYPKYMLRRVEDTFTNKSNGHGGRKRISTSTISNLLVSSSQHLNTPDLHPVL
jgi:hypothetical protein